MNTNTTSRSIIAREKRFIPAFAKLPYADVAFAKGEGVWLEDFEGKRYIDFLSSASSANLGHGNSRLAQVAYNQMSNLSNYTSAYFYTEPAGRLAEILAMLAPGSWSKKVAFGMTGSDAIDGMIKLVRAYTGRSKIISFVGAYHGSTLGAISLSAISPQMRRKIGPLLPEIYHFQYPSCYRCPFGNDRQHCDSECLKQLDAAFSSYLPPEEVAAVVIEPVAGDAGLVVPTVSFMKQLKKICEHHGILFVADEIQQAMGRTGKWFSIEHFDVIPDIVVMGKTLGAGLPMSAIIGRADIMDSMGSPAHLFTMGGNPTVAATAVEQINIIDEQNLLENAQEMGAYFVDRLKDMQGRYPFIGDVRGLGLSIGVDLVKGINDKTPNKEAAIKICSQCIQSGLVMIYVGGSTLRIQPPLIIDKAQADHGLDILDRIFEMYHHGEIGFDGLEDVQGW